MKFQNKGAASVQIISLWISQPRIKIGLWEGILLIPKRGVGWWLGGCQSGGEGLGSRSSFYWCKNSLIWILVLRVWISKPHIWISAPKSHAQCCCLARYSFVLATALSGVCMRACELCSSVLHLPVHVQSGSGLRAQAKTTRRIFHLDRKGIFFHFAQVLT